MIKDVSQIIMITILLEGVIKCLNELYIITIN